MKLLISFLFFLLFLVSFQSNGQLSQFEHGMDHSQCKGEIPQKLRRGVLANVSADLENNKSDRRKNKEFYYKTQYYLNSLLKSGKVLFGDEMNDYVNQVAKNVLIKSGNDSLLDKITIFILKSNQVNAIAMQDGSIFITVGLLAQIENEAQLAFTIAHEITHVILKHNLESYEEVKQEVKDYRYSSEDVNTVIERLSDYSKQKELQADSLGYEIFTKAGYDGEESIKMLYVLLYSHLPFDELDFSTSFFNRENYEIPKNYLSIKSGIDITDNSSMDDTYSTHPNIENRIESIEKLPTNSSGITEYSGDSLFSYINTKARFENQYLNLISKNFFRVVYESYLLKLTYPKNEYLDDCIAKGLYGLSKFKTYPSLESESSEAKRIEGNTEAIKNMYDEMSNVELATLALKSLYELGNENATPFMEDLIEDLIEEMNFDYTKYKVKNTERFEIPNLNGGKEEKPVFVKLSDEEYAKLSKVDKIIYQKKLENQTSKNSEQEGDSLTNKDYYLMAFYEELTDENFKNKFEKSIEASVKNKEFNDFYENLGRKKRMRYDKKQRKKNLKNSRINADSIVLIEPFYYSVDVRKEAKFKIKESIKKRDRLSKETGKILRQYNKSVIDLTSVRRDSMTTQKLNLEYAIKEWMNEKERNDGFDILPFSKEKIDGFFDENGYKYILETGIYTARIKSDYREAFAGLIIYPLLPLTIAYAMTPKYVTYKYATLYDTNGKELVTNLAEVSRKGNVTLDRLFIEDFVRKISVK